MCSIKQFYLVKVNSRLGQLQYSGYIYSNNDGTHTTKNMNSNNAMKTLNTEKVKCDMNSNNKSTSHNSCHDKSRNSDS